MTGIPTHCTRCALPLDPTNITRLCAECKHIERDQRRGYTTDEVTLDEARQNFMTALTGHYRPQDITTHYSQTCRCGRFRARNDTGKCEWCSRPWKPRAPKRTTRKKTPAK